jgi:hypothetical protein
MSSELFAHHSFRIATDAYRLRAVLALILSAHDPAQECGSTESTRGVVATKLDDSFVTFPPNTCYNNRPAPAWVAIIE